MAQLTQARAVPVAGRWRSPAARREALVAYSLLLPWILGFVCFVAGPILASLYLSLTTYNIAQPPQFVGLGNFIQALTQDPLFWGSLAKTFIYAVIVVPLGVSGALLVAILLNQGLRLTSIYRALFFLPHLTPFVAAVFIWEWLLDPTFGFINNVIWVISHVQGPGWLSSPDWAMPALILIAFWAIIGGDMMLIFLAGLQGVPPELYEVASLDGAGVWSRFWNITLPMISPTLFFNSILAVIGALQTFTTAFVATGGGPSYATYFYALHIYNTAFSYTEMGYASALAWIFFIILIVFTFIQFRASKSWVYYAGEVNG
ncbi:MAG TPA: sugar ABC transporter permease [Chloroflexota bacterium]|nr:sugar ABC transporter permease [Chloroflexota bacterium]